MKLTRTHAAHLIVAEYVEVQAPDKFIENCLTQHLAVVFYSEMEERLAEIIELKLTKFTSGALGRFLLSNMEGIIRRTRKSDITSLVLMLNEEAKAKFDMAIHSNDVSVYSNVITARHNIGHKQGAQITLRELDQGIAAAEKILAAVDDCLD